MLTLAYRHLILPAYESVLHRRKNFRYWKELERSQWLPREQVERVQFENLRRLVKHAGAHSPYYRDLWSAHDLTAGSLSSVGDFRRWPLLSREEINRHGGRIRSTAPKTKFIAKSTGGSSGVPLHFAYDTNSGERRFAAWYRGYGWAGAAPGSRQLWLWGMPLGKRPRAKEWKDRLYSAVYRRRILNSFDLSESRVLEFLAVLNRFKPENIVAYTSPLYTFAQQLESRGLVPFSPRSIVVGAEKLYDFQRELIERVFRAPVFETYGSREFMLMSAECDRHEGLHLTAEQLLVEVLDDSGRPTPDGQEGNVVVTDLFNYGMPFVRYANGDRAVAGWHQCSCGRGLPLMRPPLGRTLDVLTTPDGRRIPGEFFPHLLKDFRGVKRFQVVQNVIDRLELRLVLGDGWTAQDRDRLEGSVREVTGPIMQLDIVRVDVIPLTPAGKLRVVLNNVARRASGAAEAVGTSV
jgi:phenylacetate-CoA ligase